MIPAASKVAPDCTTTVEPEPPSAPAAPRRRTPAETVCTPVWVLVPASLSMPAPDLMRLRLRPPGDDIVEYSVASLVCCTVSVAAAVVELLVIPEPAAPASAPAVTLYPLRSSVPPASSDTGAPAPNADADPARSVTVPVPPEVMIALS